jgi:hypothetical protein
MQVWVIILLAIGLGTWSLLAAQNIHTARQTAGMLGTELDQSRQQLRKLDDLLVLQKQWQRQYQMLQTLGPHVETARLFSRLQTLMPPEMALLEASIDIPRTGPERANRRVARTGDQAPQRRMNVRLLGVAPTDVDVANFLARLSDVPYVQEVAMAYARDRGESGHMMRQFEVTFSIRLDDQ